MENTTIHSTHIEPVGTENHWGDGAYRLVCTACGHWHTYRGREFSRIEGERHDRYMNGRNA